MKIIREPVVEITCYAISNKFLEKNAMIYIVKSFSEAEENDVRSNILIK